MQHCSTHNKHLACDPANRPMSSIVSELLSAIGVMCTGCWMNTRPRCKTLQWVQKYCPDKGHIQETIQSQMQFKKRHLITSNSKIRHSPQQVTSLLGYHNSGSHHMHVMSTMKLWKPENYIKKWAPCVRQVGNSMSERCGMASLNYIQSCALCECAHVHLCACISWVMIYWSLFKKLACLWTIIPVRLGVWPFSCFLTNTQIFLSSPVMD